MSGKTKHKDLGVSKTYLQTYIGQLIKPALPEQVSFYGDTVTFQVEGQHLTFEGLSKLSQGFTTKLIDIGAGHSGPGCDTCGHGETTWVEITIREAKLPKVK